MNQGTQTVNTKRHNTRSFVSLAAFDIDAAFYRYETRTRAWIVFTLSGILGSECFNTFLYARDLNRCCL